jgi:hypothetical protein
MDLSEYVGTNMNIQVPVLHSGNEALSVTLEVGCMIELWKTYYRTKALIEKSKETLTSAELLQTT